MSQTKKPYLSVVVTARNDDHGGNLMGRTQAFVNGFLRQCGRHRVAAELIFVEWNPPSDRPRLEDALRWPDSGGYCDVRIIEVPAELHKKYRFWEAMPLYQMIAKNVGIRRAYGEFVLATNIDILFSDDLMRFLGDRRLDPAKMYRVDRWDVMEDVPVDAPVADQLAYCESHIIRVNKRDGTFRLNPDGSLELESDDITEAGSGVKLGDGWFHRELSADEPFRWVDNNAELVLSGSGFLVLDIEPGPGVSFGPLALEVRDRSGCKLSEVRVKRRSIISIPLPASGDGLHRVRLYARNGGHRIPSDLRTMNFRVFRCSLEQTAAVPLKSPVEPAVRIMESRLARLMRGWKLLREIVRGNPDAHIRLPLSRNRLARLQLREDGGALSFSAQALRSAGRKDDVLPVGVQAIWESGWYPIEHFAGESFRWMQKESLTVWLLPPNCPGTLALHVEPGPAAGFKQCDVEIRDSWGKVLGVHPVHGRTVIRLPLDSTHGTLVTHFKVRGSGKAVRAPRDPREMALRLLDCAWEGLAAEHEFPVDGSWTEALPGIWCGRGWDRADDRSSGGPLAQSGAELLIRAATGTEFCLGFEVAAIADDVELDIQSNAGESLWTGRVGRAHQIQILQTVSGGTYCPVRFLNIGDPEGEKPFLLVLAVIWQDVSGARTRINLHTPRVDAPVPLHTNACGDFTLLARDRWLDLRAYPEFDMYSMNIDSVFCFMARHGGAREEVLDGGMRIYHIEHSVGSGWTPEGARKLFERLAAKGISWVDYQDLLQWARIMNRLDAPMIFNRDDWGLAKQELRETTPGTADSI